MSDLEDALERARAGDANGMAELYRAYAAPLLGVKEIERQDVDAALGEPAGKGGHERALLRRAGAVREDERGVVG